MRSRLFVAGLFGVIGAAAALAITGNFPGTGDDEEPTSARVVEKPTGDFDEGRSFGARTPAPERPGATRRTASRPVAENDYYDQLYEQYFGEVEDEEDEDFVYVPPEDDDDGSGGGTAGEPGQPGIPDDDNGDNSGGEGGPAGPGGAAGDG